jgi:hypothetical protein
VGRQGFTTDNTDPLQVEDRPGGARFIQSARARAVYWRRIFSAYLTRTESQLTFWHETPEVNPNLDPNLLGEYHMTFTAKADYPGSYDGAGIPMLDYRGEVGLQYNPIAIAQYGLGNYNLFVRTVEPSRRKKFMRVADWLVDNIEQNPKGQWVWNHHFDWEYRTPLKAPWYSALAQGQAISALVRAHELTSDERYLVAARQGFESFLVDVAEGGVSYTDDKGQLWFEETIVDPPTHILNGFMWASWGIHDYWLHTRDQAAADLFERAVQTLSSELASFDAGFWSLYEQSGTRMRMLASPFYHRLHIVQLRVMAILTGNPFFSATADRWERFSTSGWRKTLALAHKSVFKLAYY